jgi:hypothetical protein
MDRSEMNEKEKIEKRIERRKQASFCQLTIANFPNQSISQQQTNQSMNQCHINQSNQSITQMNE